MSANTISVCKGSMQERADGDISWKDWSQWTGKRSHPNPSQGPTPEREASTTGQWDCTELCLQCSGVQFLKGIGCVKVHNCGFPVCPVTPVPSPHVHRRDTCVQSAHSAKVHRQPPAWHKSSLRPRGMLCGMRSCRGTGEHKPQRGTACPASG